VGAELARPLQVMCVEEFDASGVVRVVEFGSCEIPCSEFLTRQPIICQFTRLCARKAVHEMICDVAEY